MQTHTLAILYSYRRCPYAMRARMALKYAGIPVSIREISLREKPAHLLAVSPKGTVPVLVLPNGEVLEESLDIMQWALEQQDIDGWLRADADLARALITQNDTGFKSNLDRYKYPERYPEHSQLSYRAAGEVFLQTLETRLQVTPYLFGHHMSVADIAIFPFIRQFAAVDANWFATSPYTKLIVWLNQLTDSDLFVSIMQKQPTYKA